MSEQILTEDESEMSDIDSMKLSLDAIGMIVSAEILTGNQSKYLYTILGIIKMTLEELK